MYYALITKQPTDQLCFRAVFSPVDIRSKPRKIPVFTLVIVPTRFRSPRTVMKIDIVLCLLSLLFVKSNHRADRIAALVQMIPDRRIPLQLWVQFLRRTRVSAVRNCQSMPVWAAWRACAGPRPDASGRSVPVLPCQLPHQSVTPDVRGVLSTALRQARTRGRNEA